MEFFCDVPQPFGLEATLKSHGWFQLVPFYWNKNLKVLNWAIKIPGQNPTVIQLSEKKSGRSGIRFSSAVPIEEQIVLAKFRHVFNLDLDLSDFYSICKNNSRLKGVLARGMGRLMRSETLFEDLFKSICGTNVKWNQAVKMVNRIAVLGEQVPGTDFRVFPTPDQILSAGESFIRETGRAGYRSGYLTELAARFVEGEPLAVSVERGEMEKGRLKDYFLGFKGIGKTTARYLAALYGDYSEMAIDSLVVSYMAKTYFNGSKPSEKQIRDLYEPFGRWKYLVYWMEFIEADGWTPDEI